MHLQAGRRISIWKHSWRSSWRSPLPSPQELVAEVSLHYRYVVQVSLLQSELLVEQTMQPGFQVRCCLTVSAARTCHMIHLIRALLVDCLRKLRQPCTTRMQCSTTVNAVCCLLYSWTACRACCCACSSAIANWTPALTFASPWTE